MKLRVRYEERYETIEVDADEMWVTLSLESDAGLSDSEKERLIQEVFDKRFNRPDYNNWQKHNRHLAEPKSGAWDKQWDDNGSFTESILDEAFDDRVFKCVEIMLENKWNYESVCEFIRSALKPEQAEMVIAIDIDGMSNIAYAAKIGDKPNNVSHRLRRAEKKLKNFLAKRPF